MSYSSEELASYQQTLFFFFAHGLQSRSLPVGRLRCRLCVKAFLLCRDNFASALRRKKIISSERATTALKILVMSLSPPAKRRRSADESNYVDDRSVMNGDRPTKALLFSVRNQVGALKRVLEKFEVGLLL